MKWFAVVVGWIACSGILAASDRALSVEQNERNGGYYLLHHLLGQEANVDKIMLLKNAPPEIGRFTKSISALANESLATLDRLKAGDSTIDFDKNPLPVVEIDVRKSLAEDKQHQLLFGTTGPAFVRALLVSQIEAGNYAEHLAKIIARQENGDTRSTVEKISGQWADQVKKAYALLGGPAAH